MRARRHSCWIDVALFVATAIIAGGFLASAWWG